MRARPRQGSLLMLWSIILGVPLSTLVACTPLRGYPGVERSPEEVAVVAVDTSHVTAAVVNGQAFGSAGISLLPGTHRFELAASHGAPPHSCRPYSTVDTQGFDTCQKEREGDIRKGKKDPKECLLSAYTKHRKTCLRDYQDSACEVTLALQPGKAYELQVSPPVANPPVVVTSLVSGSFLTRERIGLGTGGTCRLIRTHTEQEDYEATW